MSLATSSSVHYCLHGGGGAAAPGEQPNQVLEVRLRYQSRLMSRSLILQETPATPMANAAFALPPYEINDPLFLEAYVGQLLFSLNLPAAACGTIARKILAFVAQLAAGNTVANLWIVAFVDYIQMFWIERVPGRHPAAVEEETVVLEEAPAARKGAAESAIARLKKEKFEEETEELGDCSVCLDEIKGGSGREVIKLPCGHVYHESCILTWLWKRNSCPLCRSKLEE